MVRNDFAVMILSHGRADNVKTVKTLKGAGYTGKWYIIIDNEDSQEQEYINNFGKEHIIIFDKVEVGKTFDIMDNFQGRGVPTFARNAFHKIAKGLGLNYFLELEDDYTEFRQRYEKDGVLSSRYVLDFDSCVERTLDFLDESGALAVAWAQTGDFIGGLGCSMFKDRVTRKCMNSFFCRVDKPFKFLGRFNDDVNAYTLAASRGDLMLTVADLSINQLDTQQNSGGITEAYLTFGTYVKSFYSVIGSPSNVKISVMGVNHMRIHHSVDWEHCAVKIISDKFKKK